MITCPSFTVFNISNAGATAAIAPSSTRIFIDETIALATSPSATSSRSRASWRAAILARISFTALSETNGISLPIASMAAITAASIRASISRCKAAFVSAFAAAISACISGAKSANEPRPISSINSTHASENSGVPGSTSGSGSGTKSILTTGIGAGCGRLASYAIFLCRIRSSKALISSNTF